MVLDQDARMTLKHLAAIGQPQREIARNLGVTEGAIRYHLRRQAAAAQDGRARRPLCAADRAEAIGSCLASSGDGPVNLAAMHDWRVCEFGYQGCLRSVPR